MTGWLIAGGILLLLAGLLFTPAVLHLTLQDNAPPMIRLSFFGLSLYRSDRKQHAAKRSAKHKKKRTKNKHPLPRKRNRNRPMQKAAVFPNGSTCCTMPAQVSAKGFAASPNAFVSDTFLFILALATGMRQNVRQNTPS